jgi:hypothetical protein
MKAQTIDMKTSHVQQMMAACVHALVMSQELEDTGIQVRTEALSVSTGLSSEPKEVAFIITKGKQTIKAETAEDLTMLVALLDRLDDLLEDEGGPTYCYAGSLVGYKFSVKWDAEFNVVLTKAEDE